MSIENVIYRKQKKVDETLNIWAELADLGDKYGAVSLGKGVTHFQPPEFLVNNLLDAIKEGNNHYTNSYGHPEARRLIAEHYSPKHNRKIDPLTEVLITSGAVGALDCILQSLVADENDEIVVIEPRYYEYPSLCQYSRGTIINVPLTMRDDNSWELDLELFKSALSSKTRVLLFNNPHNPSGKTFTFDELTKISEILSEYPN